MFIYSRRATLYPFLRSSLCIFYIFYGYKNNKIQKKNDPWFTMGKNIKVMPQPILSTFPGKGRDTLRLKTQVFWLKNSTY